MSLPNPPSVTLSSPYVVPADGSFTVADAPTEPSESHGKKELNKRLKAAQSKLRELQRVLYAHDHHSVLLVFQAMDAAGKDGTIRAVMTGVNPAGCQVHSFKQPSSEELDHDFLWRTARRTPERGRIGIYNRSYYEEVLVVRVHPNYLKGQRIPDVDLDTIWEERMHSIREHEAHLARNGTTILKFWLNVSHAEQKARFLSRLDEPEKNWKFAVGDVQERQHWPAYMSAYEQALRGTSRPWAPWLAIPADDKAYMRVCVAEALVSALEGLDMHYPEVDAKEAARFDEMRALLEGE